MDIDERTEISADEMQPLILLNAYFAAIHNEHVEVVISLLLHGVDVNKQIYHRRTGLDAALLQGDTYMALSLLQHGARMSGMSLIPQLIQVLTSALERNLNEVVDYVINTLIERPFYEVHFDATSLRYMALIALHTVQVNKMSTLPHSLLRLTQKCAFDRYESGETVLHVAARQEHILIVKSLLQVGANVDEKYNGLTPLYVQHVKDML